MNGLVMTLEEGKICMCLAALLCEQFCRFANPTSWDHCFVTVYSAAVKCYAKLLPFRVNCRLHLAGLGKKREETAKPTCFSLLYGKWLSLVPQTPQPNHSQYSSPVEAINLIVDSKSQPVELDNSTIGSYMCRQGKRKACNHVVLWILMSLL